MLPKSSLLYNPAVSYGTRVQAQGLLQIRVPLPCVSSDLHLLYGEHRIQGVPLWSPWFRKEAHDAMAASATITTSLCPPPPWTASLLPGGEFYSSVNFYSSPVLASRWCKSSVLTGADLYTWTFYLDFLAHHWWPTSNSTFIAQVVQQWVALNIFIFGTGLEMLSADLTLIELSLFILGL